MAGRRRKRLRLRRVDLSDERLSFEPRNESGVVLLFGRYAERLGFRIVDAQQEFPDCTATYGGREIDIEFEHVSRNFESHGHNPNHVDLVVCWRHNWPNPAPKYRDMEVLELRKYFGLGWNVWIQSLESYYADEIPGGNRYTGEFSVPSQAGPDDLLLIYRPLPDAEIRDVVRVASTVEKTWAGWREDWDWMADYQRVATLNNPLTLDDIAGALGKPRKTIGRSLQGRPKVTPSWPKLRQQILRKNPDLKTAFELYGPSRAKGR